MKDLIRALGYLGISQMASLIFGLARTKIIAIILGPLGLGVFSQANNLMELVRQISSFGMGEGFLRLAADFFNHRDTARLGKIIITILSVFAGIGFVLTLGAGVFSTTLSQWVFDDPGQRVFVLAGVVAGVLSAEFMAFLIVYQAMLKWVEYALVSVIGYAVNITIAAALIFALELPGAVLSILAAQIVNLIIVIIFLKRRVLPEGFGSLAQYRPDLFSLKGLARYIVPLGTVTLAAALAMLLIRSAVVHRLGADANGIYQVVYAISLAYMGLVRSAFTAYGTPKITAILDQPDRIIRVQNDELRLGLIILCPLVLLVIITRSIWIPILYSVEFLPAAPLLVWQSLADIVRMLRLSMNISLLPRDRLRFLLVDGLLDWLGWAAVTLFLLPVMGIAAVPFGYMLSGIVSFVVAYIYHRSTSSFRIYTGNFRLLGKAGLLLLPGMLLAQWGVNPLARYILPGLLIIVMLVWMPAKSEYRDLINMVRSKLGLTPPNQDDD